MQLNRISVRKQDGKLDTQVHLTDKIQGNTDLDELTSWNLGSTDNGGLKKLIDLSNSINNFFLESSLGKQRGGILGCRSYGLVYVISRTLEKWDLKNYQSSTTAEDRDVENLLNLLPSLLAMLMDDDQKSDLTLPEIRHRIYIPAESVLDASTIRKMIRLFNTNRLKVVMPIEDSNYPSTHIFGTPAMVGINTISVDHNLKRQDFFFNTGRKLRNWAESDIIPGHVSESDLGVYRISYLANALKSSITDRAALTLKGVCRTLADLQSIRIKQGASIFALTTRPTSAQLKLLYKLDVSPPPFVTCECSPPNDENIGADKTKSEEIANFGLDTLFDYPGSFRSI